MNDNFYLKIQTIQPVLMRHALRLVDSKEDAEDVVQEVLISLWLSRERWETYRNWEAVAVTALKNRVIDIYRKKKVEYESIENQIIESNEVGILQQLEQKDEYHLLCQQINKLPELQRLIIIMKEIEGFEIEEIAKITLSSVESIRMNLSRARKKLRLQFNLEKI
jgi:RNA polymerase sigma-70 factor (ECF subfamily)